ncbi:MAG: arginine--tRNA ligase, partial [Candidatus Aenigmarchaeota archaeon]|nr:arginine--tRNA ligase [Candidatus Aenigmarchaeota archaeon]
YLYKSFNNIVIMKNIMADIRKNIVKELCIDEFLIEEPVIHGDFAVPCFKISKEKNPAEYAKELSKKLKIDLIKSITPIGPYINFYIDWKKFNKKVIETVLKEKHNYGSSKIKETVMMDVFQANPFKAFHIGHVKNALHGESLRRILEFTGRKTYTVNFNGDVGIHVARWLLYYNKYYKGKLPSKDFTKWVGEIYAKAANKAKEDIKFEEQAQELNRKIDKKDKEILKQWKKIRDLCYKDFEKIRKELDIKVDKVIPESECVEPGKKIVMKYYTQGKLKKSNGAIGIDLEKYGLGFFLLLKADGTALYSTKDIGLLELKKKWKKFDKQIYVVATEQEFYFKQLFRTFDILGLYPMDKCIHAYYSFVRLKQGKMSSRLGNIILYEDLRDEAIERVKKEIQKRKTKLNKDTIKKIAMSAIKFTMLYPENRKPINFDWDEALNFEGKSGPYLQYSYVRALKILEKVKQDKNIDYSLLNEKEELQLIKKIAKFPDIVIKAANEYSPSEIAKYAFKLCSLFSVFYEKHPVISASEKLKKSRSALVAAFKQTLENCFNLLGMYTIKKM